MYHGPEDVRVEDVPRPETENPGDALVRVIHTAICGSDLWPYRGHSDRDTPSRIGHEPMGIIEEVGEDVWSVQPGDRVFVPFIVSCGECEFCRRGLHTSCVNGDSWSGDNGGAQGKYVRSPHADGALVRIPDRYDDEETLRAALPLTDVLGTGHYADRLDVAEAFGAADTVLGGEGGVDDEAERVRDLTHGGAEHVLECVSATSAMETAVGACRPGETVGYVGVPHGTGDGLDLFDFFGDNITLAGGVAPVHAHADDPLADVLGGTLDPSPVFTKTVSLEDVDEGYRAMDEREAVKVLVKP